MSATTSLTGWERVAMAIEKVRERLLRVTAVLNDAGIQYAVVGGNAVAEWVGRMDDEAVRFTKDVDLLIRRQDLPAVIAALAPAGFTYHQVFDVHMFLDGPAATPKEAVHLLFAGEKVKPADLATAPNVTESEATGDFSVLTLEALVRMKLTAFRDKDKTHLRDMLGVGLIDATWPARLPREFAERLQSLLDSPEG